MAKINSLAARFSGTVTYNDNSVESFHSQCETTHPGSNKVDQEARIWSIDQTHMIETTRQVSWSIPPHYPYYAAIDWLLARLPFAHIIWMGWIHPNGAQKTITDMITRLDMIITRDDNVIYPVALVMTGHDANAAIRVETPDQASDTTNVGEFRTLLLRTLNRVLEDAILL
jgi:hypothetical protein